MHENYWPACARISRARTRIMLGNPLAEVPRNAGIERLVRTPDNVDIPVRVDRLSAHEATTPLDHQAVGSLAEVSNQANPRARIRAILAVWGSR